jgi:hypothetical protein
MTKPDSKLKEELREFISEVDNAEVSLEDIINKYCKKWKKYLRKNPCPKN